MMYSLLMSLFLKTQKLTEFTNLISELKLLNSLTPMNREWMKENAYRQV